jgi:hypothetical protein
MSDQGSPSTRPLGGRGSPQHAPGSSTGKTDSAGQETGGSLGGDLEADPSRTVRAVLVSPSDRVLIAASWLLVNPMFRHTVVPCERKITLMGRHAIVFRREPGNGGMGLCGFVGA